MSLLRLNIPNKTKEIFVSTREFRDRVADRDPEALELLSQMFKPIIEFSEQLRDGILSEIINRFRELSRIVEQNSEIVDAFNNSDWPLSPSIPSELRYRVLNYYKTNKIRNINNSIIGYYRRDKNKNLILMVENWKRNPLFSHRMKIITDALNAHINHQYTLSIPALSPQIEGILTEYLYINSFSVKLGKSQRMIDYLISEESDNADYSLIEWSSKQALAKYLKNGLFKNTKFEDEYIKNCKSRTISRHTILHGINYEYYRLSVSLKLFITLDAINSLKEIVRE